jgi:hypothetical protein
VVLRPSIAWGFGLLVYLYISLSKFGAETNLICKPTGFSSSFQEQRILTGVKVPFFVSKMVIIFLKKGILGSGSRNLKETGIGSL